MYAVYCFDTNSTPVSVLSDLIKIISGETNKANLSAQCVQVNTSITSTVPAGWTVFDAAAGSSNGTTAQMVRALNQDGTSYKYSLWTSLSTGLRHNVVETWNASTHTGTNATTQTGNSSFNPANGGYLYIYATQKNIYVQAWDSSGFSYADGCIEMSRDTIPSTYPCAVAIGSSFLNQNNEGAYLPRKKNGTSNGDSVAAGVMSGPTFETLNGLTFASSLYRDANENTYLAATKICFTSANDGAYVPLGHAYDVLCTGKNAGNALDEISYNGATYVFLTVGTRANFLVPKA